MKARVLKEQADLFEIGVLSQTAELSAVSVEEFLGAPSGQPLVIAGRLLSAGRIPELRSLAVAAGRAHVAIVLVPPFNDLDVGRYFDTPAEVRAVRRTSVGMARIIDQGAAGALGGTVKVRSDHYFETALGAGVMAVDDQGKRVLFRFQSTNASGPVFFCGLQLLSYTALTDEEQRQATLSYLLSWEGETRAKPESATQRANEASEHEVDTDAVAPVALLLAAGGAQSPEVIVRRASLLLGTEMSVAQVNAALAARVAQGLLSASDMLPSAERLGEYLEQRGLHAYLRELRALLAAEESDA